MVSHFDDETGCSAVSRELIETARDCCRRGWAAGTNGNFSAKVSQDPFRLVIARSGSDKGALSPDDFVIVDHTGAVTAGLGRPSGETVVHVAIARATGAGAILHTHSASGRTLSRRSAAAHGVTLCNPNREWLPVIAHSRDFCVLAQHVSAALARHRALPGLLIEAGGLFTWGADIREARRRLEIVELLAEATVQDLTQL